MSHQLSKSPPPPSIPPSTPLPQGVQRPTSRQNSVRLARVISVMQAFRSSRSRSPSREVPRPARVLLAKQRARCTAVVRLTRTLTDQEPGEGEGREGGRTPPSTVTSPSPAAL